MADPIKFAVDFRVAVTEILAAIDKLDNLCAIAADLSYDASTFASMGTDISGDDFWAALAAWRQMSTAFEPDIRALTKLRP